MTRDTGSPIDTRPERIVSAARDEIARRGWAAAREDVIARRAGVALATLKRYFPDRGALLRQVPGVSDLARGTVCFPLRPAPPRPASRRQGGSR